MPICTKCNIEKTIEEFSFKHKEKNIRSKQCKKCVAIATKKHYENNKQDYIKRATINRENEYQKSKDLMNSFKTECIVCKENWKEALDFHHIDPNEKEYNVSQSSRAKMLDEVKKCVILCATCHRKYHSGHKEIIAQVDQQVESGISKVS